MSNDPAPEPTNATPPAPAEEPAVGADAPADAPAQPDPTPTVEQPVESPSEPVAEPVAEAVPAPAAETAPAAEPTGADESEEPAPVAGAETPVEAHADSQPEEGAAPVEEPAAPVKAPKKPRAKKAPAPEPDATPVATDEAAPAAENKKKWYAIKVQSGREDSIKAAVLRKVRIEGLDDFFGRIEIPVEEVSEKKLVKVKDKKTGETSYQEKKVTRKKKKFQGYLFAELEFNDRILYLFRETAGVGDFLNLRQKPGQPPTPEPMPEHEVQSMLTGVAVKDPNKKTKVKLDFEKGDKVRVREGSFANSEGEVKAITDAKDPNEAPKVLVVLTFWGRPLEVEFDASQVEKV